MAVFPHDFHSVIVLNTHSVLSVPPTLNVLGVLCVLDVVLVYWLWCVCVCVLDMLSLLNVMCVCVFDARCVLDVFSVQCYHYGSV